MASLGLAPAWELGRVGRGLGGQPWSRMLSTLPAVPRLRRHESALSLQQFFQCDTLQQKLRCLEEENQQLRMEVSGAGWRDAPRCAPFCPARCRGA